MQRHCSGFFFVPQKLPHSLLFKRKSASDLSKTIMSYKKFTHEPNILWSYMDVTPLFANPMSSVIQKMPYDKQTGFWLKKKGGGEKEYEN